MTEEIKPPYTDADVARHFSLVRELSSLVENMNSHKIHIQNAANQFTGIIQKYPYLANAEHLIELMGMAWTLDDPHAAHTMRYLVTWIAEEGPDSVKNRLKSDFVTIAETDHRYRGAALVFLGLMVEKGPGPEDAGLVPLLENIAATRGGDARKHLQNLVNTINEKHPDLKAIEPEKGNNRLVDQGHSPGCGSGH